MELTEIIHENYVAYEFRPAFSLATGKRVQVGYDVVLYGSHDGEHGPKGDEATCEACLRIWEHLRAVAAECVAGAGDASVYTVEPFRSGFTIANRRKAKDGQSREDVELVLEIRHRGEHKQGVSACEEECLQPVLSSLHKMGVQRA